MTCNMCEDSVDEFVWSWRKNKYVQCYVCFQCWKRSRKQASKSTSGKNQVAYVDEANILLIGENCGGIVNICGKRLMKWNWITKSLILKVGKKSRISKKPYYPAVPGSVDNQTYSQMS